jgi:transcription elongation factor
MNIGDKVKITCGEFQGRVGQIKARHMKAVPSEMKNNKAGVTIEIMKRCIAFFLKGIRTSCISRRVALNQLPINSEQTKNGK